MLTIICGEDTISSRESFLKSITPDVKRITVEELLDLSYNNFAGSGLFDDVTYYAVETLIKKSKRSKSIKDIINKIISNTQVNIITWEEYIKRDLTTYKGATITEYKSQKTIFNLLDLLIPGKGKDAINLLQYLTQYQDIHIIFSLIYKHIKLLTLISNNIIDSELPSWQLAKLKKQSASFKSGVLVAFFEGLQRLEVIEKTSSSPLSLQENLEVLIAVILKTDA